jgi:maltose O-acetyltransferase
MKIIKILFWPFILLKKLLDEFRYSFRLYFFRASGVKIGKDCFISPQAYIDKNNPGLIEIGDNCMITRGCIILSHTDEKMGGKRKIGTGISNLGKVMIGNNVFIGVNTVIMPGITIGDNVIIGAMSLVNSDIPSDSIAYGIPAKVQKSKNPINKAV